MTEDSWIRSWTKSFTWRVLGILILFAISYLLTRSLVEAGLISLIFHALRVVLYTFHERIWEKIEWERGERNPNSRRIWFFFWLTILILAFLVMGLIGANLLN